jgi:SAM-dependent methyltransferase
MNTTPLYKCSLCGSEALEQAYITHDRHYGIEGTFTLSKCTSCGLVFVNPMPTEDYLTSLYPPTYYSYQDFYEKDLSTIGKIYKKYLVNIGTRDPHFKTPGKILDIGCGSGQFLYKMKKKGWIVSGVEVSESAAKLGNELEQLNIYNGNLLQAKFPGASFDYIRSNHSFEHITNPEEVLQEIHRILKPGGKLLIGVPNIVSFNARLFKKYWWYLGAPVHTYNYSVSTLSRMLEKHGFKVERVTHTGDYSGILGSFQIYLNKNSKRKSGEGFFINSRIFRIIAHWIAKVLNRLGSGDAIEIICTR